MRCNQACNALLENSCIAVHVHVCLPKFAVVEHSCDGLTGIWEPSVNAETRCKVILIFSEMSRVLRLIILMSPSHNSRSGVPGDDAEAAPV